MHLYTEAKSLALAAWNESEFDLDQAQDYLHQSCDSHEVATYYGKAIEFCATQETSDGEDYLEDCGSLVQGGDTFGQIACRIAYATLYCAAMECLQEIADNYEEEEES